MNQGARFSLCIESQTERLHIVRFLLSKYQRYVKRLGSSKRVHYTVKLHVLKIEYVTHGVELLAH
jgi:hypothetical protein